MKHLLIISFCLLSFVGFAAKYTYNDYPITTRTYKKLFRQFKNKLFVLSDGKVICPVDPQGETKKISFEKKQYKGEISGTVLKIINKNTFTLKIKEMISKPHRGVSVTRNGVTTWLPEPYYHTVAISGVETSNLFRGETFTANVIPTGAYVDKLSSISGGQRMRKFDVLKPITAAEFKSYLDAGNKLYTYRKKLSGYTPCTQCQGKGHLPNPANKNRKSGKMAQPDLNCPDCKFGKNPVYKYTKIPIKPRRKKIAAR